MIEFKQKEWPADDYQLLIDGTLVEYAYVYPRRDERSTTIFWDISTRVPAAAQQIISQPLSEYLPIECIDLIEVFDIELVTSIYIAPKYAGRRHLIDGSETPEKIKEIEEQEQKEFRISFTSEPNLSDWTRPYSYREYCEEFARTVKAIDNSEMEFRLWHGDTDHEEFIKFTVIASVSSLQRPIKDEIAEHTPLLRDLHERAERELMARRKSGSVVSYFDFPEEVRVPCEQYLLYFAQFLRDLGIEASSDLTHEAGRVLFTVTPKDEHEALDIIRAALEAYLQLPSNPISEPTAGEYEVAIQRLVANVHHLKSQLALQQAVLQAKDATIQALQFTAANQQRLLGGEVMIDSLSGVTPPAPRKEKEELLGGTVAITIYEGKGFEINLPELFRMFRRLFTKKDKGANDV
jgi:hypothetical protein